METICKCGSVMSLRPSGFQSGRPRVRMICRPCEKERISRVPRAQINKSKREWDRRNSEKRAAHKAVELALLRGALTRLGCEKCGERAHAHHDDYSKPLLVRWLCPQHHAEAHHKMRAQALSAE